MGVSQDRKNSHTGTEQICTEKARSSSSQEKKSNSHTAGINRVRMDEMRGKI